MDLSSVSRTVPLNADNGYLFILFPFQSSIATVIELYIAHQWHSQYFRVGPQLCAISLAQLIRASLNHWVTLSLRHSIYGGRHDTSIHVSPPALCSPGTLRLLFEPANCLEMLEISLFIFVIGTCINISWTSAFLKHYTSPHVHIIAPTMFEILHIPLSKTLST